MISNTVRYLLTLSTGAVRYGTVIKILSTNSHNHTYVFMYICMKVHIIRPDSSYSIYKIHYWYRTYVIHDSFSLNTMYVPVRKYGNIKLKIST